jgi:hypothetical protein
MAHARKNAMITQQIIEKQIHEQNSRLSSKSYSRLKQLFKQSWLIKNGIFVYLKHLIPFFSRITNIPAKQYAVIKSTQLLQIRERVGNHMEQLKFLYEKYAHMSFTMDTICEHIHLEELQDMMQPEIDKEQLAYLFDLYGKTYAEQTHSYQIYLESIHYLEQNLYENYKEIADIYAQALSSSNHILPFEASEACLGSGLTF